MNTTSVRQRRHKRQLTERPDHPRWTMTSEYIDNCCELTRGPVSSDVVTHCSVYSISSRSVGDGDSCSMPPYSRWSPVSNVWNPNDLVILCLRASRQCRRTQYVFGLPRSSVRSSGQLLLPRLDCAWTDKTHSVTDAWSADKFSSILIFRIQSYTMHNVHSLQTQTK